MAVKRSRNGLKVVAGNTRISALPIKSTKAKRFDSRQVEDTGASTGLMMGGTVILPVYDIELLIKIFNQSNTLSQCVEAMVTNTCLQGHKVVAIREGVEINQEEADFLKGFLEYVNPDESMTTIQAKMGNDYERVGFGFFEVVRDIGDNVSFVRHLGSKNTKIMTSDGSEVTVKTELLRGNRRAVIVEKKRFKRYVQEVNGSRVFFKEFGDPRDMDYQTGEYSNPRKRVPLSRRASEVIHFRQYSDDVYGLPRWHQQMPSVLGSREAEEVNLKYFEDNMIPAAIMSVAGGRLTDASFRDLKTLLNEEGLGKDRQNKILLVEAIPEQDGLDDNGGVRIQLDKLTDGRPSDALFADYDKANQEKIRSSFRLPPVTVGLSQDVTFATANVSMAIAETQVFAVQRRLFDEMLNRKLINNPRGLNLQTVKVESRGPAITNPEQIVKTLTALNVIGAVTPRTALEVANEELQVNLGVLPEKGEEGYEEWMDQPMPLSMITVRGDQQAEQAAGKLPRSNTSQKSKGAKGKKTEGSGDTGFDRPENGQQ